MEVYIDIYLLILVCFGFHHVHRTHMYYYYYFIFWYIAPITRRVQLLRTYVSELTQMQSLKQQG